MRLTWQNLSDGRRHGFFEGRAWLWGNGERGQVARFEWSHCWSASFGCEVSTGGGDSDSELRFHVALGFAHYWLTFSGLLRHRRYHRTTGIRLFGDHFALRWRCDDSSWSSKTGPAAGWMWSTFLLDRLLGANKYREGEPQPHRIAVRMPEGVYHGTAVMRADSWKRPLWFRKTIRRAHIDMDEGEQVPVPGKDENSWDCDEDAIYGMTCSAETPGAAAAAVYESAMRSRRKYGSGERWRPSRGPHALSA